MNVLQITPDHFKFLGSPPYIDVICYGDGYMVTAGRSKQVQFVHGSYYFRVKKSHRHYVTKPIAITEERSLGRKWLNYQKCLLNYPKSKEEQSTVS